MKRSTRVELVLLSGLAATTAACDHGQKKATRYCVDDKNQVSDDWECEQQPAAHHWYFYPAGAGSGGGAVARGTTLQGGTTAEPSEGYRTAGESETTRGGIGAAGEEAGAHGGGGEGHGGGGGE